MNNNFLKAMNHDTKVFFTLALDLIEWVHSNGHIFSSNQDELTTADEFSYGFLLAGIIYNEEIRNIFSRYNVTFKNCFSSLPEKFATENSEPSLEETFIYNAYDFNGLKDDFIKKLKERLHLEDKIIKVSEIEWYQIFYYICMSGKYNIERLLRNIGCNAVDEIYSDIEKYISENDKIFIDKIINTEKFLYFDNISLHFHNNGRVVLIPNDPKKTFYLWYESNNYGIQIEHDCEIISINDEKNFDYDYFVNDIMQRDYISLELKDIENNQVFTVSCNVESIFGKTKDVTVEEKDYIEYDSQLDSISTTFLEKYGKELTNTSYLKDPSIGRDKEIRQIEQILLYPEKDKSIVIVGDAGVGKTALVRGLSYRIQNGDVPNSLKNIRIFSINVSSLVAGTKYVGTLEEKMKNLLDEASKSKNIILFIDEIHQAIGGGKSEGNNNTVSEILKPYIDYGDVRIISATTLDEYNEYIQNDTAFKTRLKKVSISEPTEDVLFEILYDLINKYNKISYSKLDVSEDEKTFIINWLIESTQKKYRKYNDKASNPRLILDIIKEAYAIAAINDNESVTFDDLCEALMNEDRLYESSKLNQIRKIKNFRPKKRESNIIKFVPKKREN